MAAFLRSSDGTLLQGESRERTVPLRGIFPVESLLGVLPFSSAMMVLTEESRRVNYTERRANAKVRRSSHTLSAARDMNRQHTVRQRKHLASNIVLEKPLIN